MIPTLTSGVGDRLTAMLTERGTTGSDLLFQGQRGGPMRPVNWRGRVFRSAVRDSGIEDWAAITPHSLRHGAVAGWIAAGVTDGYLISRWLGHGSPASAYRLYGHLLPVDTSGVTAALSKARSDAESITPAEVLQLG